MKILLSNDDGVHAPGIKILKKALDQIADVTVIAPLEEKSATGHTITLDSPLRMVEVEKNVYGCSGYPADCVLMALGTLFKDQKPDLIVSGINRGANVGQDTYYSGTVAAAREGAFNHISSIAVSLVVDFENPDREHNHYETAANYAVTFIKDGGPQLLDPLHLMNINVPNLPEDKIKGVQLASLGQRRYSQNVMQRVDFRNREYFWIGGSYQGFEIIEETDCVIVHNGYISLSPLNILPKLSDTANKWKKFLR